jgi:hypothetical protein
MEDDIWGFLSATFIEMLMFLGGFAVALILVGWIA